MAVLEDVNIHISLYASLLVNSQLPSLLAHSRPHHEQGPDVNEPKDLLLEFDSRLLCSLRCVRSDCKKRRLGLFQL